MKYIRKTISESTNRSKKENKQSLDYQYNDRPIETLDQDLFDRKQLVDSIIQIIQNDNTNGCSKTIGIFGSWGSGKTSIVNFIKDKLKQIESDELKVNKNTQRTSFIEFNSWHYKSIEELRRNLHHKIILEMPIYRKRTKFFKKKCGFVLKLLQLIYNFFINIKLLLDRIYLVTTNFLINNKIVFLIFLALSIYYLPDYLPTFSDEDQKKLGNLALISDEDQKKLGNLALIVAILSIPFLANLLKMDVEKSFDNIKNLWKKRLNKETQLIIIFDDLDRDVDHGFIIELFKITLGFLDLSGITFIFSMDRDKVANTIAKAYSNHGAGYEFIEKYIEYPFFVLEPSNEQKLNLFVKSIKRLFDQDSNSVQINDILNEAKFLPHNPRKIKSIAIELRKIKLERFDKKEIDIYCVIYFATIKILSNQLLQKFNQLLKDSNPHLYMETNEGDNEKLSKLRNDLSEGLSDIDPNNKNLELILSDHNLKYIILRNFMHHPNSTIKALEIFFEPKYFTLKEVTEFCNNQENQKDFITTLQEELNQKYNLHIENAVGEFLQKLIQLYSNYYGNNIPKIEDKYKQEMNKKIKYLEFIEKIFLADFKQKDSNFNLRTQCHLEHILVALIQLNGYFPNEIDKEKREKSCLIKIIDKISTEPSLEKTTPLKVYDVLKKIDKNRHSHGLSSKKHPEFIKELLNHIVTTGKESIICELSENLAKKQDLVTFYDNNDYNDLLEDLSEPFLEALKKKLTVPITEEDIVENLTISLQKASSDFENGGFNNTDTINKTIIQNLIKIMWDSLISPKNKFEESFKKRLIDIQRKFDNQNYG